MVPFGLAEPAVVQRKKSTEREKLTNLPKNVTFLVRKELEDKEDRGSSKWHTIFIRISIRMVYK